MQSLQDHFIVDRQMRNIPVLIMTTVMVCKILHMIKAVDFN
jgi:hypothetical protein